MEMARKAELEAVRLHGRLVYEELLKMNPPNSLTYHYRSNLKKSTDAEAAGDFDEALRAAKEARKQASLAIDLQSDCKKMAEASLKELKKEIEGLYRPSSRIIKGYWEALEITEGGNCALMTEKVEGLKNMVAQFRDTTMPANRVFRVYATLEYVKTYGHPYMYAEITEKGFLARDVNQVLVGTEVIFVRSKLYSPSKTFYLVKDPDKGIQGWMAEERVWPERARRSKGAP